MQDCYQILGVPHTATSAEIRRAYHKKAKLLHPDVSNAPSEAFRNLVKAYETLSDAKSRQLFDAEFVQRKPNPQFTKKNVSTFDYRTWLIERADEESMAKLIFFDLMHHREDDAVLEFKQMNMKNPLFKMSRWFSREDFMDLGFILSEELVLRAEYYDAVLLLSQIIQMEYAHEYFKIFFPEVLALMRHVLRHNIEGVLSDELAIDTYERALELRLGTADEALFLQRMGAAYERIGDKKTALLCREEAMRRKKHG